MVNTVLCANQEQNVIGNIEKVPKLEQEHHAYDPGDETRSRTPQDDMVCVS